MLNNYKTDKCYIVAEIGGNFTTFGEAKRLIDEAAGCNVDAVKLQTYRADTITSRKAIFNMENTGIVSQHELFKKYEIGEDLHGDIFKYAESKGLDWFSTPSHETDADMLDKFGVSAFKIGSDDAVNIPFLKYLAKKGKPMILATGMCTMQEVRESVSVILEKGNDNIILLHAITSYPTHPEDVNLLAIQSMMMEFPGIPIGYSDHSIGITACIGAAALGAKVIEKHFTYDKKAEGPDHMLSADPHEMNAIVGMIREFEIMKGNGIKRPSNGEKITRINNRKSITVIKNIKNGEIIRREYIDIKRPGYGIAPKFFDLITGKRANKDLEPEDVLQWSDIG